MHNDSPVYHSAIILSSEFPPGPGGIGVHANQLATQLVHLGWAVTVIAEQAYASDEEVAAFNTAQPFAVTSLGSHPTLNPRSLWERRSIMQNRLESSDYSLVIATGSRSTWVMASLFTSIPWVAIGHGSEFGLKGWKGRLTRWAFEQATHVVCVSDFTHNYMLKQGFRPKASSVIHNGADARVFSPSSEETVRDYRQSLGLKSDDIVLLTVGNVTERKGQDLVIRALAQSSTDYPQVQYLIAGLPTKKNELAALANELGVAEQVHFLGRVSNDDLLQLYNICDVFLMTSRETASGDFEGFGIAAIEAALCGKPAVVTGNSGLSEAVVDGYSGLVANPNDPDSIAEKLKILLDDPAYRLQLGKNARKRALAEQTWSKKAEAYNQLFETIIQT